MRLEIAAILLLASFLTSCEDKNNGPAPVIPGGAINGTIDGQPWASEYIVYNRISQQEVHFLGGRESSNKTTELRFSLKGIGGTGTYTLNDSNFTAAVLDGNKYYYATSGQVQITQDDSTWFKASFSFTGMDSLSNTKTASGTFQKRKK